MSHIVFILVVVTTASPPVELRMLLLMLQKEFSDVGFVLVWFAVEPMFWEALMVPKPRAIDFGGKLGIHSAVDEICGLFRLANDGLLQTTESCSIHSCLVVDEEECNE
jgi:hypothetical protein